MRRLAALLLAALPAAAQISIPAAPCSMTDGSCAGGSSASYATLTPPATCTTAGMLPIFLGSPLALGCDAGLTYTTATLAAPVHYGTTFAATAPATVTITNATNATPIVVTATAHGLRTNDRITISGITGNTNANGYFKITRLTADTFSLQNYSTGADVAGNGAFGGTPVAVTGIVQANRVLVGDGTAAAPSMAFASYPGTGAYASSANVFSIAASGGIKASFGTNTTFWTSRIEFGGGPNLIFDASTAATLQLGGANAAAPVGQRLRSQGAATGTDIIGADLNISPGPMTGTGANYAAGRYGALRLGTYVAGTTGTTTSTTTTDRIVIAGRPIVLTAGSATNIVHIDIPALAGASWDITYSVVVTDSAAPVQMKVLGGRYYGSAYRLAAGNAVPNAVTETGDNGVHSVGGAGSDVMTFTGDATGVMVAHNITVGTGLTAPNTVVGTYVITVAGTGAVTATMQ